MTQPELNFDHLSRLSTPIGVFEHALFTNPRLDHGYCLDDVARGLVVTSRQPDPSEAVCELTSSYLQFTIGAQDEHGRFRNRRAADGAWQDEPSVDDHWGRALWGLGTAASSSTDGAVQASALRTAGIGFRARSPWPRAMAYAALGAFEVLRARPGDHDAVRLLSDARALLGPPEPDLSWPWPEARLSYANAVLPEALLVIGAGLDDETVQRDGLTLLTWLVEQETRGSRLSVTPAGGWERGEPRPGFDQQPIEVAALAEACWRAFELTGDSLWATTIERCVAWFLGDNDAGVALYQPDTGGGFDGLHRDGVNQNQGAESTLAALSTLQLGRLVAAQPVG